MFQRSAIKSSAGELEPGLKERKENSWLASTSQEQKSESLSISFQANKENTGDGGSSGSSSMQRVTEEEPERLTIPVSSVNTGQESGGMADDSEIKEEVSFLSISVNHVDTLVPQTQLTSPLVRVSLLDGESGQYLGYRNTYDLSNFERKGKQKGMKLLTERVPPNVIPPAQTEQCLLKRLPFPKLAATWNSSATFPQDIEVLQMQNCLVMFEIFQPVLATLDNNGGLLCFSKRPKTEIPIAWAFLRLKSHDNTLNLGHLRLQLYDYKGRTGSWLGFGQGAEGNSCAAFAHWKKGQRSRATNKYNATMYVTLEKVTQKKLVETPRLLRQVSRVLGFSKDNGGKDAGSGASMGVEEDPILFDLPVRKAHELCKIPNSLGQYLADSARGTTYVSFANQGKFIAIACADVSLYSVRVFNLETLSEVAVLTVHHDTIYEICWSSNDRYLVTASSDHTAKVWSPFEDEEGGDGDGGLTHRSGRKTRGEKFDKQCLPMSTLQHLTFVYTAKFHPTDVLHSTGREIVVTGSFDHSIRVWNALTGELLQTLHKAFKSHINALAFDVFGKYLYAGDGKGIIKEYMCNTRDSHFSASASASASAGTSAAPSSTFLKFIRVNKDLEGEPISCIQTLSSKRRLVVLTKRSNLCSIDLGLFAVGKHYHGIKCLRSHIRFCISPDERFILSGSEDGRTFIWNIESAQVVQLQHICNAGSPITCISWSPYEHVIAVSTFKPEHPIMIFLWDETKPQGKEVRELEDNTLQRTRAGQMVQMKKVNIVQTPRRLKHMSQVERERGQEKANILADLPTEMTPDQVSNIIAGIKTRMAKSYERDYLDAADP